MGKTDKLDHERRRRMVAEAAYYRAEKRGFRGDPLADWIEAEKEIESGSPDSDDRRILDRIEEQVATASTKLKALRRKVSRMKSDARKEWKEDAEKLADLRDSLKQRLEEIRERGEHASRKAQKQAEKLWDEISEIVQRTTAKRK
jgi:predicted RNase H-like nuclease (RuvC/YqgF family)